MEAAAYFIIVQVQPGVSDQTKCSMFCNHSVSYNKSAYTIHTVKYIGDCLGNHLKVLSDCPSARIVRLFRSVEILTGRALALHTPNVTVPAASFFCCSLQLSPFSQMTRMIIFCCFLGLATQALTSRLLPLAP